MAKRKTSVKKVAATTGQVVAAGYAWRLAITGGAAKRKAQKNAVRSDLKRVGRGAKKAANSTAGRKVRATKVGTATERSTRTAFSKGKAFAGAGPKDLVSNVRGVKRPTVGSVRKAKGDVQVGYHSAKASRLIAANPKVYGNNRARRAGVHAANAATHLDKNKGKYAAGAAVGVVAGAGAVYAYKRHKAKKTSSSASKSTKSKHIEYIATQGAAIGAATLGVGLLEPRGIHNPGKKRAFAGAGLITAGVAGTYVANKRYASKQAAGATYKRKLKSGKVITVRKGRR